MHNASYGVRLKIPYQDLATGNKGVLYRPEQGDDPLTFPFAYAPGWKRGIEIDSLLGREDIFQQMDHKFREILAVLADENVSGFTSGGDE